MLKLTLSLMCTVQTNKSHCYMQSVGCAMHTVRIIKSNYEIYMFDEDLLASVHGHYDY